MQIQPIYREVEWWEAKLTAAFESGLGLFGLAHQSAAIEMLEASRNQGFARVTADER